MKINGSVQSLSLCRLHNTFKDSGSTWDGQEDVNLSLFLWVNSDTMRGGLEINSTCVCVAVKDSQLLITAQASCDLWTRWCPSFLCLLQHHLTALCETHNARVNGHPFLINSHYALFLFPWFFSPYTAACTAKTLKQPCLRSVTSSHRVWGSRGKKSLWTKRRMICTGLYYYLHDEGRWCSLVKGNSRLCQNTCNA